MNPTLASLLLDLSDLSDEEAEQKTYEEYIHLYMDRKTHKGLIGVRKTHDGDDVLFYEWRFEHAFFESAYKTSRKYNKGKFARNRAARIRWIGEIIKGNIKGCDYCQIPHPNRRDSSGRVMLQRVYILWEENYLIWLEPHRDGGWWFSSAYTETRGRTYIRRNIASRGWCKRISRD